MEYGNIVWGGTFDSDIVKLERIQIDAIRLITGATAKSNIANLYKESRLRTIQERINGASLCMMYKIINGHAPEYLQNILTNYRNHPITHNLRYRPTMVSPFMKETTKNSFFHKGIELWEHLPEQARLKPSIPAFKSHLKKDFPKRHVPYYYGKRWPQIHHARMRMGCSKLNEDLALRLHVINDKRCQCGFISEDAHHYLFVCPLFDQPRADLLQTLNGTCIPSTDLLLFGDPSLPLALNNSIFQAVHSFMITTGRFT
jgi:hypothetical protein